MLEPVFCFCKKYQILSLNRDLCSQEIIKDYISQRLERHRYITCVEDSVETIDCIYKGRDTVFILHNVMGRKAILVVYHFI